MSDNQITIQPEESYKIIRNSVLTAQSKVYTAVNSAMVQAYWEIGQEIHKACGENDRAEYGKKLLEYLSEHLTKEFGKGFTVANLKNMRQFYRTFPNRQTLSSELSWSHYNLLMRIEDEKVRQFYADECVKSNWSVRQLKRQINSFYYERLLASQDKESIKNEIGLPEKVEPKNIIRDPYVLEFLGLTVGLNKRELTPQQKQEAHGCDVTYTTNAELGFDYLRDNMVTSMEDKVLVKGLNYALIDEVDSILIDESRTPLIISGGKKNTAALYLQADRFVKSLIAEKDYEVDIETKTVSLTPKGIEKAEKGFKIDNLYDIQHTSLVHHINQALKANYAMTRDVEYMIATEDGTRDIRNAKIMIIDQFTGRVMPGRAYSDGLHQAIEAKEGVPIKEETETRATITYQNFFRLFNKLAGMTGTAKTEEEEFMMIYNMRVIEIPTNKPVIRDDRNDKIYSTKTNKFKALCDEVVARHAYGQPILIGTVSVETSEILSKMLDKRGIKHNTLNAKNHAKEAEIIARAGQKGAVTIATNMAGRGTDIKLGKGVPEIGGLAVIGSERHESRRIDNQLRGRSGRQGDPGYSVFYVSFDDELMQRFAGEKLQSFSNYLDDDMAIENKMVSKAIENAQKRVEGQNFDSRKHILEYDDVMRQQREIMYKERDEIMSLDNLDDIIKGMFNQAIEMTINRCTTHGKHDEVDVDAVLDFVAKNYMLLAEIDAKNKDVVKNDSKKLLETLTEICFSQYQMRLNKDIDHAKIVNYERSVLLGVIDYTWINHIDAMTKLRNGIYLRAYAQKNPLSEYTEEAFYMFEQMKLSIVDMISKNIVHMGIRPGSSAEENIPHLK